MYIFDHVDLGIVCFACPSMPSYEVESTFFDAVFTEHEHFVAGYDYNKMLKHIDMHRKEGYYIPEHVDARLILERDCEHDFKPDGYCKHCWRK